MRLPSHPAKEALKRAPPDLLAGFVGPLRREGKGKEGKEGEEERFETHH